MRKTVVTPEPLDRPLAWVSQWSGRLLAACQGSDALDTLHRFLGALAPVTNFIVFEFARDRQPVLVDSNYDRAYMQSAMAPYCGGLYLLDPFWRTVVDGRAGLVRMDDIAPEDFRQSEYFLRHYQATDVVDELRFVVPLASGACVHVFVEREGPLPAFDEDERSRFGDVEPLVRAFVERHVAWLDTQRTATPPQRPGFDLREQIRSMQPGDITARETDIIELMLKGHAAKSMARTLDIEEGTVTNHKRNIYAKLGIHSQAQLFDRFLRTLTTS
jgi:DNA-binding CsgD family transcriptional regulator